MRIQREELIRDLEMVKSGVSPREFIEQSSCFCFQDGMVMTFNDEVACRKRTCLKTTGAVQASALLDILTKMPEPELRVMINDRGELEFQGKRRAFAVVKDAEIFLPIDRVEVPKKWHPLPPEFTEAIGLVQHCVSTDENHFLLTCIHLHPDFVEACDNLQLLRARVNIGLAGPVLVRGTSLASMASLAMNAVALTGAWLHFRNQSGLVYSCRRYVEDYPDLGKLLQVKGHPLKLPKGLVEASDRSAVFAADKAGEPLVTVTLREGALRIKGEGLTGWYKEVKKTSYHGPPMEFLISPELLGHISEKHSEAIIGGNKLKVSGGSWSYVTVLGRKTEETEKPKHKKKSHD